MVHACGEEKPHQGMSRWYCVGAPYGSLISAWSRYRRTSSRPSSSATRLADPRVEDQPGECFARTAQVHPLREGLLAVLAGELPVAAGHGGVHDPAPLVELVGAEEVRDGQESVGAVLLDLLMGETATHAHGSVRVAAYLQPVGTSDFRPSILRLSACEILLPCWGDESGDALPRRRRPADRARAAYAQPLLASARYAGPAADPHPRGPGRWCG